MRSARNLTGTIELARCPKHEAEFDIGAVARAEIPADVEGENADLLGVEVQDLGDLALLTDGAAAAGIKRVAVGRRVIGAQCRTRLERHTRDAADVIGRGDDVSSARKGRIGRRSVAEFAVHENIVGKLLPHARRVGRGGFDGVRDPGELLVIHGDHLGRGIRLLSRLGDDHGDRFADIARLVGRQQHVRADEDRRVAAPSQPDIELRGGDRIVGDVLQAISDTIRSRVNTEHARHFQRRAWIDAEDARMRIGRTDHSGPHLARQREVVGEPALAGDQASIFLAGQRLADRLERSLVPQWAASRRSLIVILYDNKTPIPSRSGSYAKHLIHLCDHAFD